MAESPDLPTWSRELADAFGLEHDVDLTTVLDLARIAAHGVARPAAPVTTFIAGLAVARGIPLAVVLDEVERRTAALHPDAPAEAPPPPTPAARPAESGTDRGAAT